MSSTKELSMDLGGNTELRWLSAILSDVREAAPDVDFLVVGAIARDLLLHYGHGVPIKRATTDVDLGVAVADWPSFRQLRDVLLNSVNFDAGWPASHNLIHRSGTPLDLVPYGGVEREDGTIVWPEDDTVMGVIGYKEARDSAVEVTLPDDLSIVTVCLPMLAVLKLIAWSERHLYTPRTDASDLFAILSNYLSGENAERLYEVGTHLLNEDDFDYQTAGAWLAGYDAARCVVNHSEQPRRVFDVVEAILEVETNAKGDLHLVSETGSNATNFLERLGGFFAGLTFAKREQAADRTSRTE